MVGRIRIVMFVFLVAAAYVAVPPTARSASSDLRQRLVEVAALYGDGRGSIADIVEGAPAREASGLLGVALSPSRPVVVFAFRGSVRLPPFPPTLGERPRRRGVICGALDRRTGKVLAVEVLSRRPNLQGLGRVKAVRLVAPVKPPAVVGRPFDAALADLGGAGYRVSVPAFPRLPGAVFVSPRGLGQYLVADALPLGGRAVRLRLLVRILPIGSPAVPVGPPTTTTVPNFVGMSYTTAIGGAPGLYVRLGRIGALRPDSSRRGLDAFVVTAQAPAAGTVVPAFGERTSSGGYSLAPSTVTLTIGVRGPGGIVP